MHFLRVGDDLGALLKDLRRELLPSSSSDQLRIPLSPSDESGILISSSDKSAMLISPSDK
ncbi:MAG: hypothetical protein ACOY46_13095 [Bacillota bacterium]